MGGQEYVELTMYLIAETEAALLLTEDIVEIGSENVWIPKSQIRDWDDFTWEKGALVEIEIKEWIAIEKGLV